MDREQPRSLPPVSNTELFAVREANRASAYMPTGMLEPLKSLQSTPPSPPSSVPEISVLSIPTVAAGPEVEADFADDPSPIILPTKSRSENSQAPSLTSPPQGGGDGNRPSSKSNWMLDPRAEQSPTQSGSSPLGGNSGPATTLGAGTLGAGPAAPSSQAPPTGASGNAAPARPHHPTTAAPLRRGTRADSPSVDWYHSIASIHDDRPIQEICQRILNQFPRQAHSQLLFTSADPAVSTNRTVGKIASVLAQSTSGDVLLIDANWEANLPIAKSREKPQIGLAEILAQGFDWRPLVLSTQVVGLRVLPCGAADVPHRQINSNLLLTLAAEWRRDYAYVLINGGFVKQLLARRFAGCCDGAYVMVELNRTTKSEAQAASKILAESKARTMGAIVFDSASDS